MSTCGLCEGGSSRNKPSVNCNGHCNRQFHATCVGISTDLLKALKQTDGIQWLCVNCRNVDKSFNQQQMCEIFKQKLDHFFADMNSMFDTVKSDFTRIAEDKLKSISAPSCSSYAEVTKSYVSNTQHSSVIIKPKRTQTIHQTKSEVLQSLDPLHNDCHVKKVKHVKDGGLLLTCNTVEDTLKIKEMAEEKLVNYEIRNVKGVHPRIRIVGLTQLFDIDYIGDYLLKQNTSIFDKNSHCKVIKCWPTKNNKDVYQAILQVDSHSYNRLMNNNTLLVGLDSCIVYDNVTVSRCFKCNSYNHSSKFCKQSTTCPRCAEAHEVKDCKSQKLTCINCQNYCVKYKVEIGVDHAVWEYEKCHAYKAAVSKLKSDLGISQQ